MARRVGICAVAQTTYARNKWDQRFQGMALEVVGPLLEQTGLSFDRDTGIGMTVSNSDDVFDATYDPEWDYTPSDVSVIGANVSLEAATGGSGANLTCDSPFSSSSG